MNQFQKFSCTCESGPCCYHICLLASLFVNLLGTLEWDIVRSQGSPVEAPQSTGCLSTVKDEESRLVRRREYSLYRATKVVALRTAWNCQWSLCSSKRIYHTGIAPVQMTIGDQTHPSGVTASPLNQTGVQCSRYGGASHFGRLGTTSSHRQREWLWKRPFARRMCGFESQYDPI